MSLGPFQGQLNFLKWHLVKSFYETIENSTKWIQVVAILNEFTLHVTWFYWNISMSTLSSSCQLSKSRNTLLFQQQHLVTVMSVMTVLSEQACKLVLCRYDYVAGTSATLTSLILKIGQRLFRLFYVKVLHVDRFLQLTSCFLFSLAVYVFIEWENKLIG